MKDIPRKISGTLLMHFPFLYEEERIEYLKQVLDNVNQYSFSRIDIVIDTDSVKAKDVFCSYSGFGKGEIRVRVHEDLEHPIYLTWKHRDITLKEVQNYDFFIYSDADILIPLKAIQKWYEDTLAIYPHGYVRGFLRVEKNKKGELTATDISKRFEIGPIKVIEGRKYFIPPQPYHGFWLYTKEQMEDFIRHKSWADGNPKVWGIGESATAGLLWDDNHSCRALVPIGPYNNVLEETFAYHLPGNFSSWEHSPFGKILIQKIFISRLESCIRKKIMYEIKPKLKLILKKNTLPRAVLKYIYATIKSHRKWYLGKDV